MGTWEILITVGVVSLIIGLGYAFVLIVSQETEFRPYVLKENADLMKQLEEVRSLIREVKFEVDGHHADLRYRIPKEISMLNTLVNDQQKVIQDFGIHGLKKSMTKAETPETPSESKIASVVDIMKAPRNPAKIKLTLKPKNPEED